MHRKEMCSCSSGAGEHNSRNRFAPNRPEVLPVHRVAAGTVAKRTSVSAEAFGKYHKKEEYVPFVVAKDEDVKNKIKSRL